MGVLGKEEAVGLEEFTSEAGSKLLGSLVTVTALSRDHSPPSQLPWPCVQTEPNAVCGIHCQPT